MNWRKKQWKETYYQKAKSEGYRSRAAYKLIEIQNKFKIIKKNNAVVDLGCAPGGWLQVIKQNGASFILGIDLKPIEVIQGVNFVQMDFNDSINLNKVLINLKINNSNNLNDHVRFDLILSDMLPDLTGDRDVDYYRSIELVESVFDMAQSYLKPYGNLVCKILEGSETKYLIRKIKDITNNKVVVKLYKPLSSRSESRELYLIILNKTQE